MKSKNTIELNGTRYDAVSGAVLNNSSMPQKKVQSVDGFFRPSQTNVSANTASTQPVSGLTAVPAVPGRPKQSRTIAVHASGHKPQRATTLVRTAVKKPGPSLKQQTNVQGSLQHKVPSLLVPKRSVHSLDAERLVRAANVERSPKIARHANASTVPVLFQPITVQPTPKPQTNQPAAPAPQPTNKPLDMFEHAVANASNYVDLHAHRKHYKKKTRQHVFSMAAGSLALLIVAGFVAYQNSPQLQLKLAGMQSGVSAHVPDFKKVGFSYNGYKASDGKLSVGLKNTTGDYELVQQNTNWTGTDMIANVGSTDAGGSPIYNTVQTGDTTVYRFANNQATWVSSGTWYTVSGTGALTDSQVSSLVSSL